MQIDRSRPVLVTGGNGYIASWLVKMLLEDGMDVHATVRDPSDNRKVGHLLQLAQHTPGKLSLYPADLLKDGSFDLAMAGCELVFHTASPFVISGIRDPQKQLVDPAVNGTRNVLASADRCASVRRVVLTSSCAAIYGDNIDQQDVPGGVYTEAQWNSSSSLQHQPYSYSKLAAERAAWEMARAQDRWQLVVINPGLVLGPALTRASDSTSLDVIKQFIDGRLALGAPDLDFVVVDVRDVALAHIRAGLLPEASGRHITISQTMSLLEMGRVLRRHYGWRYPFPRWRAPKWLAWLLAPISGVTRDFISRNVGYPLRFDNSYACRDLQMRFRPFEETLVDHFQQLIDDGVVKDRRPR
ncbi:dihydroflavonol-4-reductase [Solimonas aquatica]|uniref:Dihydroflavonol-4-reductase n=1 Tax=Solimonas aquatica TaxID=489703 RepID=A0A1H9EI43_9GAMM|nr:NAD-dependent epimerase/dehydratase family protein [Solimonas aquatica]SEQ25394.1 dihydroflavonol-4-reductase [Solimonas aquatica]